MEDITIPHNWILQSLPHCCFINSSFKSSIFSLISETAFAFLFFPFSFSFLPPSKSCNFCVRVKVVPFDIQFPEEPNLQAGFVVQDEDSQSAKGLKDEVAWGDSAVHLLA